MGVLQNQTRALVLKSLAYQRKNWCMNCAILTAPIVVTILLFTLQSLINNALDSEDNRCGCKCTACTFQGKTFDQECPMEAYLYDDDDGEYRCTSYDENECGYQYSTSDQVYFCAIESPNKFPPAFAVLESCKLSGGDDESCKLRPGDDAERVPNTFLYTGKDPETASRLVNRMLPVPDLLGALTNPAVVAAATAAMELLSSFTWDLSYLSVFNFAADKEEALVPYLDSAFLEELNIMSPDCMTTNGELGLLGEEVLGLPGSVPSFACSPIDVVRKANAADIEAAHFCAFDKARCGPSAARYTSAFDFGDTRPGKLDFTFYNNDSSIGDDGPGEIQRVVAPVDAGINSWLQDWLGDEYSANVVALTDMPKVGTKLTLDFVSLIGPLFFMWLIQLPLPISLVQLVYEKEKRLRMMMRMHGLSTGVYMVVTYIYFYIIYVLYIAVMLIAGSAAGLKFYTLNGIGVQLIFYLLYGHVQVSFCFVLSCLFKSARTAIISAFLWVFASGLICLFLLDTYFIKERAVTFLLELIPAFGAYRGLWEFAQYAFKAAYSNENAMQLSDVNSDGNGMLVVWIIFLFEIPFFMALAWYLEQVLDSGIGIRKHWNFPFKACAGASKSKDSESLALAAPGLNAADITADVLKERDAAYGCEPSEANPIVVRDLRKTFPPIDGNKEKVAVANMSLKIPKGECFGLLGPNGAGKSTSINMMIGFMEATYGEAYIGGHDMKTGMNEIYKLMGVCPQHDLLWETLSSREHLNFYARLKGLQKSEMKDAVDSALKSVELYDVGSKPCGKYSGGMKRRLSVAISLIGSPKVVYLDEPSTGLDPASRRNLWDVVKAAKQDKAVILTTHSMEEAEVLCDRLGIFVDGLLVCIGNPKELTARYGGYYMCTVTVPAGDEHKASELVTSISAAARETYSLAGTCKFEIPVTDVKLSEVFEVMATASKRGVNVIDWGIHNASLEDVFIELAAGTAVTKNIQNASERASFRASLSMPTRT